MDATPEETVTLKPYLIDIFEVTANRYEACVIDGGCTALTFPTPSRPTSGSMLTSHLPVNYVSWTQSVAFCAWTDGRLCSEAEWERAARGAPGYLWPWGNEPEPTCNYSNLQVCGNGYFVAGGSKPFDRTGAGVFDLLGNANEWVRDCWRSNLSSIPDDGSAVDPASCSYRVIKGATWDTPHHASRLFGSKTVQPAISDIGNDIVSLLSLG